MEYKKMDADYKPISPGTMGIAQKISSDYKSAELEESGEETSKLVFLTQNKVMACSQNQY